MLSNWVVVGITIVLLTNVVGLRAARLEFKSAQMYGSSENVHDIASGGLLQVIFSLEDWSGYFDVTGTIPKGVVTNSLGSRVSALLVDSTVRPFQLHNDVIFRLRPTSDSGIDRRVFLLREQGAVYEDASRCTSNRRTVYRVERGSYSSIRTQPARGFDQGSPAQEGHAGFQQFPFEPRGWGLIAGRTRMTRRYGDPQNYRMWSLEGTVSLGSFRNDLLWENVWWQANARVIPPPDVAQTLHMPADLSVIAPPLPSPLNWDPSFTFDVAPDLAPSTASFAAWRLLVPNITHALREQRGIRGGAQGELVHQDELERLSACSCPGDKACAAVSQGAQSAHPRAAPRLLSDTVVQLPVSPAVPDISVGQALAASAATTPPKRQCRFLWNEVIPADPPFSSFMTAALPTLAQAVQCDYSGLALEVVLYLDIDSLIQADSSTGWCATTGPCASTQKSPEAESCGEALTGDGYSCKCTHGMGSPDCRPAARLSAPEDELPCPCVPGPGSSQAKRTSGVCEASNFNYGYYGSPRDLCHCGQDTAGTFCQLENPCSPNPCLNGGGCSVVVERSACSSTDNANCLPKGYWKSSAQFQETARRTCNCTSTGGYTGDTCEVPPP